MNRLQVATAEEDADHGAAPSFTATKVPPLLHEGPVWRVALSADGKMALTLTGKSARLWETLHGAVVEHGPRGRRWLADPT